MWSIETMHTLYGVPYNEWFVNQKSALDAFVDDSSSARFVWFNVYTISPTHVLCPLPHEPLIMYDMFLWFDCIHHIKYRVHNESNNENWCINENILLWIKEVVYYAVHHRVSACLYVSVWLWQITWLKDTFSVYLSKICLL